MSLSSSALATRHVGIGELEVARGSVLLQANLGSCLGIAIVWPDKGLCALAHILLPQKIRASDMRLSRYADTAVAHLLRRMKVPRDDVRQLSAVVAGGAAMFEQNRGVGAQNIKAGLTALRQSRVRLVARDVGGEKGRRLLIECDVHKVISIRLCENDTQEQQWTIQARKRR